MDIHRDIIPIHSVEKNRTTQTYLYTKYVSFIAEGLKTITNELTVNTALAVFLISGDIFCNAASELETLLSLLCQLSLKDSVNIIKKTSH
jgi:hypothetical protein